MTCRLIQVISACLTAVCLLGFGCYLLCRAHISGSGGHDLGGTITVRPPVSSVMWRLGVAYPLSFTRWMLRVVSVLSVPLVVAQVVWGFRSRSRVHAQFALGIVIIALVAWLPVLRPLDSAMHVSCLNNLRMLHGAKNEYALEYGGSASTVLTSTNVAIFLKDISKCYCPQLVGTNRTFQNSYRINPLIVPPECKPFGTKTKYPRVGIVRNARDYRATVYVLQEE